MKFSKNVNNKKHAPKLIFFNENKLRKIQIIFDIKNWLWKLVIDIFWMLDLERMLIWQIFFWKSAIFHSIKLPFDVQSAEKILHVIYYRWPIELLTSTHPCRRFSNPIFSNPQGRKMNIFRPEICMDCLLFATLKQKDYLCKVQTGLRPYKD